ncbi:hypothetical protein WT11_30045 [Burkholderia stagnalis]|nr:hypothetical protein WT11_30045 [Burkholderia stagnalis]
MFELRLNLLVAGDPAAQKVRIETMLHGGPCYRNARLQADLYQLVSSSIVIFSTPISLSADDQSATQVSFFTHTL